MKYLVVVIALLGLSACGGTSHPPVAAAPCAAGLSPHAHKIYGAVQAGPREGTLRDRISNQTRDMVMSGDMPRSDARRAAIEAAGCLHQTP